MGRLEVEGGLEGVKQIAALERKRTPRSSATGTA